MNDEIIIDLNGPKGNAFVLLGIAKDLSHKNKFNWDDIYTEMTKSDYEHLIQVMEIRHLQLHSLMGCLDLVLT